MKLPDKITTWQMAPTDAGNNSNKSFLEQLELVQKPVPDLGPEEVLVEIAGCSLCHRYLGPISTGGDVGGSALNSTRIPAHDISGRVVAGEVPWIGREVLIPAVAPGRCHGLSSHISVSTRDLLEIKNRKASPPLAHLSMAVDALAIPFQAATHAGIKPDDKVMVLGLDGAGPFLVQIAKTLGAGTVMVADSSETLLNTIRRYGADLVIKAGAKTAREVAAEGKQILDAAGLENFGWKVFLASCDRLYLKTVKNLADLSDKIIIIGSAAAGCRESLDTLADVDAAFIASHGCPPEHYAKLVEWITSGTIALSPFLLTRPMSWAKQVLASAHEAASNRRIVLTPDDFGLETSLEARSCR